MWFPVFILYESSIFPQGPATPAERELPPGFDPPSGKEAYSAKTSCKCSRG